MPLSSEAYVCPICLGSIQPTDDERAECLVCAHNAPLWYLRLRGVHECERDEYVPYWERLTSTPVVFEGKRYGL
jgi:hypothetical protein